MSLKKQILFVFCVFLSVPLLTIAYGQSFGSVMSTMLYVFACFVVLFCFFVVSLITIFSCDTEILCSYCVSHVMWSFSVYSMLLPKSLHCVPKKWPHFYFLNNSIRNKPIWIILGTQHPEEILHKCFSACPPHLKCRHCTLWNTENIVFNGSSLLSSSRQYLSCDACLEVKREDNQNCFVLCCVRQLCTMISTLRWAVLTVLWIGFCHTGIISLCVVFLCLFVCILHNVVLVYCEHGVVDLMGLKPGL